MLFASPIYLCFLAGVFLAYNILPQKWRIYILLAASYIFYCWLDWRFGLILGGMTLFNYFCSYLMSVQIEKASRKRYLQLSLLGSLLVLIYFKYTDFFIESCIDISHVLDVHPNIHLLNIILPVGISFYTFQVVGYMTDVYRGSVTHEKNFATFALFMSFFPQILAGPIGRSTTLLPQLRENHPLDLNRITDSGKQFLIGMFKKLVIADRLAMFVDPVFANPFSHSGSTLAMATVFYAFQIYCDFSGYTDMALASANLFGIKLQPNFNLPYFADSISDFWKRWHISLSMWLRDYIYTPIAWMTSRKLPKARYFGFKSETLIYLTAVTVTFSLCGFWHGANWTFIFWGFAYVLLFATGFFVNFLVKSAGLKRLWKKPPVRILRILFVFCMTSLAWVLFRANTLEDGLYIYKKLFTDLSSQMYTGASSVSTFLSVLLIAGLVLYQVFEYNGFWERQKQNRKFSLVFSWSFYLFLLVGVSLLGVSSSRFIYFKF
jgi:alginate O-acetyltransferase complex protein AlgI